MSDEKEPSGGPAKEDAKWPVRPKLVADYGRRRSFSSIAKADVCATVGDHAFLDALRAAKGGPVSLNEPLTPEELARRKRVRKLWGIGDEEGNVIVEQELGDEIPVSRDKTFLGGTMVKSIQNLVKATRFELAELERRWGKGIMSETALEEMRGEFKIRLGQINRAIEVLKGQVVDGTVDQAEFDKVMPAVTETIKAIKLKMGEDEDAPDEGEGEK